MNAEYEIVLVPRESANDDHGVLLAWAKHDGERVDAEQKICELEFSKAVIEVTASRSGYLFHLRASGDEVVVGTPLAAVADHPERPVISMEGAPSTAELRATAKARKLMQEHSVQLTDLESAGLLVDADLVRERHVLDWLRRRERTNSERMQEQEGELLPLTPLRRRGAAALAESKQSIPHSYVSVWVPAEPVEARVEAESRRLDLMISISSWLVASVAQQIARFPHVNASWRSDGILRLARKNIGFALNQADGDLVVPIIHDADQLSLAELIARISGLQKKAVRHKLTVDDLRGGTLTVTSLIGSGVHQVFPILVPGQALIIGIGDRCAVPVPMWILTAAFDHRVVNGAEAAAFLAAVAEGMSGRGEPA